LPTHLPNIQKGCNYNSPLQFKIYVFTGETGKLKRSFYDRRDVGYSSYTTNWVGTLHLFAKLIELEA
jgi:hypothetical protein